MIKHIVMWKLKENALNNSKIENAITIKTKLESLKNDIDVLKHIEVGINCTDISNNYDVILYCEFDGLEDLSTYQTHPKHVEAGKFVKEVTESRVCVDYKA